MKPRYDPDHHHRHSIRLPGWDYAGSGVYFVTVCTEGRRCMFGDIVDGHMQLNSIGNMIDGIWRGNLAKQVSADLDILQVMPNHVHAIIVVACPEHTDAVPNENGSTIQSHSLGAIVGNLKAVCTRRVNRLRHTPGAHLWQRNYWEHIVRDEEELTHIRTYIVSNPGLWHEDRLNVATQGDPIID